MQLATRQPKYAAEAKGHVAALLAEFKDMLRIELRRADYFIFDVEDTDAYAEYSRSLTDAVLKRAFNAVFMEPRS